MAIYQPYYPQQYNGFQPQFQQQMPMAQMPMQQPQAGNGSNIIWVQGETGAKSYLVAPGNTVPLWDSENQTIYIKSVDVSGMPSMEIIDYTKRSQTAKQPFVTVQNTDYIRHDAFDKLQTQVNELSEVVEQLKGGVSHGEPSV